MGFNCRFEYNFCITNNLVCGGNVYKEEIEDKFCTPVDKTRKHKRPTNKCFGFILCCLFLYGYLLLQHIII